MSRRTSAAVILALVVIISVGSLLIGANRIPLETGLHLLFRADESFESIVIHQQRLPRTVLLIVIGAALAVAGALMQSMTRNPLADPGILGINAGASLAVVLAVVVFGVTSIWFYLWFAFGGAAAAAVVVYVLGGIGRADSSPARLALAGVAISMAISALVQTIILANQAAFNEFRLWAAGSAEGRGWDVIGAIAPFVVVGVLLACALGPALNALALGIDSARALGVRVNLVRTLTIVSITLLAGAATAAVGPIMFVGLAVPFLVRAGFGADQRLVIPICALAGPVMMLLSDTLARVAGGTAEVQVGIMTAILGGPFFIGIVRRRKLEAL